MDDCMQSLKRIDDFLLLFDSYNAFYFKRSVIKNLRNEWYAINRSFPNNKKNLIKHEKYKKFILLFADVKDKFKKRNDLFVKEELKKYKDLFNAVEDNELSNEQRVIAIKHDDNNLITACAGSGKTLTIIGSVRYLIEKGVPQEDILILSYNKKIADDIKTRFDSQGLGIDVFTFHKLGLTMMDIDPKPKLFDSEENTESKRQLLDEFNFLFLQSILNDRKQLQQFFSYVFYSMKYIPISSISSSGELYKACNQENFTTLKGYWEKYQDKKNGVSIEEIVRYERVHHLGEWVVANYLFLHGIDYQYRSMPLSTDSRSFVPSFYLPNKNGAPIWIEYFNSPAETEAVRQMKINIFKEYDSVMVPINYSDVEAGRFDIIIEELDDQCSKCNIKKIGQLQKLSNREFLKELTLFKEFFKELNTILKLYKGQYYSDKNFGEIEDRILKDITLQGIDPKKDRNIRLFNIFKSYYIEYSKFCKERNLIDFDDMLILALDSTKTPRYKHIFVDEYQDTSRLRFNILNKIKQYNQASLSVIGDDWQSIYRFSGCNLELFTKFNEFVGEYNKLAISKTYRYSLELAQFSKRFIEKNPAQIIKHVDSNNRLEKPIIYVKYTSDRDKDFAEENSFYTRLITALEYTLAKSRGKKPKIEKVLFLGRNNNDISKILENRHYVEKSREDDPEELQERNSEQYDNESQEQFHTFGFIKDESEKNIFSHPSYPDMEFEFSTIHSAKGREADLVFLINNIDTWGGFPNKMMEDPLYKYILNTEEEYNYAEERRLFYVAITRTKTYTILMVPKDQPSSFTDEIKDFPEVDTLSFNVKEEVLPRCPHCRIGRLLVRVKTKTQEKFLKCEFQSCTGGHDRLDKMVLHNSDFVRCPKCNAPMVEVPRKDGGYFLGCVNYYTLGCRGTSNFRGQTISNKLNK